MYPNIQKVDEGNTCNMLSGVVSLCLCLSLSIHFFLSHTHMPSRFNEGSNG